MNNIDDEVAQRRAKLAQLRSLGNAFPNDFRRNVLTAELHQAYGELDAEQLETKAVRVQVAGRLMSKRMMGKVSFGHIQDVSGRIQLFLQSDGVADYRQLMKQLDVGDIIGANGSVFKTNKGELTVRVDEIRVLTKALRPLPEKFHGLTDQEMRYRQRYLDLAINDSTRRTFRLRTKIVNFIRRFMEQRDFLEVETPMMQSIPGGALARPFQTHHNALDMDLYLRVAPELNLKRLVVGGLERVFEINRNFRNEGISTQHNPEFTMLEFYQAYADYLDLMDLTEQMLREMATQVLGGPVVEYQGESFDLSRAFTRLTLKQAILRQHPQLSDQDIDDLNHLRRFSEERAVALQPEYGIGKIQLEIFEKTVEDSLREPTYITEYPVEVSPLSRRNDNDATVSDRFELFIAGSEIANGFSELNDPEDQAERFRNQVSALEAGDQEAMRYDADYICALEHGLPPTAGEGVGIDRLVMLFTDSPSIRDVILFPQMRPRS
ncbi:MAG: lysine--tRNA ligase [Gammaproteobacteria bacterium]|nr:lysine--tRNA ligase [Gammaproteobacteria bacterium]